MSKVAELQELLRKRGVDVDNFHAVNSEGRWVFLKDMDEAMAAEMLRMMGHIDDGWHYGYTDDQSIWGKLFTLKEKAKMYCRVGWKKLMTKDGLHKAFNFTYYPSFLVWASGLLFDSKNLIEIGCWGLLFFTFAFLILSFVYMRSPIQDVQS